MKRKSFPFGDKGDSDLEKFTNDQNHLVKFIHTSEGNGGAWQTVLYYEDTTQLIQVEKTKLTWIKEKAIELALDTKYQALSNNTQRKFYLLETYNYNSVDAMDIIEYVAMMKKLQEGKV